MIKIKSLLQYHLYFKLIKLLVSLLTLFFITIYIIFSFTFGIKEINTNFPEISKKIKDVLGNDNYSFYKKGNFFYDFPTNFKKFNIKLKRELITLIPDNWATDDYVFNPKYGLYPKYSIYRYNEYIQSEKFWNKYLIDYALKIQKLSKELKKFDIQPIFVPVMPKVFFYPEGVSNFITKPKLSRKKFLLENYLPKNEIEYFNTYDWIKKRTGNFKKDIFPFSGYHLSHWISCEITREILIRLNKEKYFIKTLPSCDKYNIEGVMWSDGDILNAVSGLKKDRYLRPGYWMPLKKEYVSTSNKKYKKAIIAVVGNSWSDNIITTLRFTLEPSSNQLTWLYDFSGLSVLGNNKKLTPKRKVNKTKLFTELTKHKILIIVVDEKDIWLSATNSKKEDLFGLFKVFDQINLKR